MNRPKSGALYTTDLLGLAVEVAAYPFNPQAPLIGEASSRSCGSKLAVSFGLDAEGRVQDVGLRLSACAVGQAAAAIFAGAAAGKTQAEIAALRDQLAHWLGEDGPMPDWPRMAMIAAARDHPGRHEAIQLPWRATLDALSKAEGAG